MLRAPPMTTFEMEEREQAEPRLRLVEMSGELDLTNTHDLEARLEELPDDDAVLALDLNRVLFVDSAALHVLFRLARARGPERLGFVLEPTAAIARTLEIVGLPRVVPVRPSADEVLDAVTAAPR
jgi:anti-anti-sigma factor